MRVDIPTKNIVRVMVSDEVRKQEKRFFEILTKLRNKIRILEDEIRIRRI